MILAGDQEGQSGEIYNIVDPLITQEQYLESRINTADRRPAVIYVPFKYVYGLVALLDKVGRGRWRSLRYRLQRSGQDLIFDTSKAKDELGWPSKAPLRKEQPQFDSDSELERVLTLAQTTKDEA